MFYVYVISASVLVMRHIPLFGVGVPCGCMCVARGTRKDYEMEINTNQLPKAHGTEHELGRGEVGRKERRKKTWLFPRYFDGRVSKEMDPSD